MTNKALFTTLLLTSITLILLCQCKTEIKEDAEDIVHLPYHLAYLNLHDSVKYVGMQSCRACHEDKYQTFIQTGMGKSFGLAKPERSIAGFHGHHPVYDPYLDFYYLPYWKNDTLFLKEFRLKNSDTIYSRTERIDYIIGSGHHTNSHLFSVNGFLFQAPFTWYSQAKKWDLPPGYEDGNNTRFKRIIGIECMSCHNAYPDFEKMSLNKFHHIPMGIDCERCHGPGELHVLKRTLDLQKLNENDTDFTIVNPAKLPLEFQIDLCQRCHLQGNTVLREGKGFFDFRPGMRLSEVMDVFLPEFEGGENEFIMASHADRMRKSKCFTKSLDHASIEPLNCMSCHNPHLSVQLTHKEHFINSCMNCHETTDHLCTKVPEAGKINDNNCISCHMPRSGTTDIPHVSITDHNIRVPGEKTVVTDSEEAEKFMGLRSMTRENVEPETLARAYLYYYEKFSRDQNLLETAFKYLSETDPFEHYKIWIHYYYLSANYNALIQLAEKPEIKPLNALTAYQTGQSYFNLGMMEKAVQYFQYAVELQSYNLEYREKLGITYMHLNQIDKAEKEFLSVIKHNPYMELSLNNLGYIKLISERPAEAMRYIDKALALNPDYIHAILNKARLHLYFENTKEAKNKLNRILELEPENKSAQELLLLIKN